MSESRTAKQRTFKNLQERYDATVEALYDTSKVNFNPKDVQYNWTKLKKGSVGYSTSLLKNVESRTFPVLSALEDAKRLTKFQFSGKGVLWLAEQALLQTGNTFDATRVINPAFVVGNAVPFVHMRRGLLPVNLLGFDLSNSKKTTGRLQASTVRQLGAYLDSNTKTPSKLDSVLKISGLGKLLEKIKSPINAARDAINIASGKTDSTVGVLALYNSYNFSTGTAGGINYVVRGKQNSLEEQYKKYSSKYAKNNVGLGMFNGGGIRLLKTPTTTPTGTLPSYTDDLKKVAAILDTLNYTSQKNIESPTPFIQRTTTSKNGIVGPKVSSNKGTKPNLQLENIYRALSNNSNKEDFIITRIKVGKFDVQFRSFITDLKETVNAEYSEKNYIGRTERFITYGGTKRELSFSLKLIAMAEDELIATHARINFLIGALFPTNVVQGLLQPPIAYLSMGDLFINQPGIFKNLAIDYPYSWEVRNSGNSTRTESGLPSQQLPMGANINVTFSILEKGTVFHQSPFHAVMEKF